ncbi:CubicO group peptidase (beta-lactamase class C family) [Sphingomonas sp. PP-F2F-A104-K0414]|uniref:serine hydrolase domain-containing protein n=1 Tax=Sphingomonas sp. PP-F2F-A104-K0414 TaxID=2135661 RepID=UPI00104A91DA|nr:serine hydrolase domain-containing protein [Sphingomonas sp. PP-F2F-A104-K0414]TCQ00119.1 CubicO group peptidase (beta-lactamase class C family) [Sphingomonas sp. PP-F2F-A104-K0414]
MKLVHWISTGALAALAAATAYAQQAQPRPQVGPQPSPRTSPQVRPTPRMTIPVNALLPATSALFDNYVAQNKMPGIVGAFGVGEGPTLFPSAGKISDDPNAPAAGPDSLWRVYSMSKPITAMSAMMLIEDGKLNLDDPVSKYIPAFKDMKVATSPDTSLATRPAVRPITIRNLLTHTAGLGYTIVTKGPLLKEYERLGILPLSVSAAMEEKMRPVRPKSLEEFANRVATLPLIAEPGTKWSYSIGLDVMGRVIEVASGMSFERFVQTRLFDPLKMKSSFWQVPQSEVGRLATNYAFVGDTRTPLDPAANSVFLQKPSFPYGGAGLVMSARDYDRFLHMIQDGGILDGVRVMKPETIALATSNLLPAGVAYGGVSGGTGGTKGSNMGFGAGGSVVLETTPNGPGKGTYAWGGAAGTIAWVDPLKRSRGNVMVNYFPADRIPLREQVVAALLQDAARLRR